MPRPHTPPTQQRTLPRSALTPPHLRDIIVPAVKSVAESTNSAGPDQSVPRPQTPPARRTLSPSAFTPPHLRKSIVPSLNSPSESKASSKQEATVSRPQTPPNQRTLAYTPPHLRKSLSPTDSTKLEATSRPADAITRPVGDTSPQPANTMRNPTHPRPHFNDDRRGSSANNARINTRNNTRNGRSRVIGQAGPAQNDDNNVARSIEPPKPRPAVAGAWGNFAANIANSDKATQAEINEKTKTLVGQSKLSETFKAIQNGNYV